MSRTLYAWSKDDKFYLSAFKKENAYGNRPAAEFDSKADVEKEVKSRRADVVWEDGE